MKRNTVAGFEAVMRLPGAELRLLDGADFDQCSADAGAALLLLFLRIAQLLNRNQALANEQLSQTTRHACFASQSTRLPHPSLLARPLRVLY